LIPRVGSESSLLLNCRQLATKLYRLLQMLLCCRKWPACTGGGSVSRFSKNEQKKLTHILEKNTPLVFLCGLVPKLVPRDSHILKIYTPFQCLGGVCPKFVPRALHILKKNTPFVHLCGSCTHYFATKIKSEVRSVIYLSYLVHRTNLERVC